MLAFLSFLMALRSSSLASAASTFSSTVPSSDPGMLIVCCCSGILGASASRLPSAMSLDTSFRRSLATFLRTFLDFARAVD
jgi:hypothetical protein